MHKFATRGDPNPNFITLLSVPLSGGAGVGGSTVPNVNVTPTSHDLTTDTPEIRKYKKRFNSEILCAALWGVNLLIGTENGLMLLDRSGQGKVYQLISRSRHKLNFLFSLANFLKSSKTSCVV